MTLNEYSKCPCCHKPTIGELGTYEICSICRWEDDPIQSENPNLSGGANKLSLVQHRKSFKLSKCHLEDKEQ